MDFATKSPQVDHSHQYGEMAPISEFSILWGHRIRLQDSIRLLLLGVISIFLGLGRLSRAENPSEDQRFFREKIEPLLEAHCFECHSHKAGEISGGLTLDSRSGWAEGGTRGPAIIENDPQRSLLIRAVRYMDADLQMPPDGKLTEDAIELLEQWIRMGAPDPRQMTQPVPLHDSTDWWSLRPLNRPEIPTPETADGEVLSTIDAFVLAKLQSEGISPLGSASRHSLIRRLFFDLHGLPPDPSEVAAFVEDADPAAYEKLVDRLLDSPRYAERWARHWLDTVHFADSHGCEHDLFRPHAWRYRDYVIDSLHKDTPWPRFIREQLAADHFFPQETSLTAALGFIAAGPLELSTATTAPITFDYLDRDDMVTQTMAAFASTTANCARCHDHKFDPIPQEDYYALQAVFAGVGKGDVDFDTDAGVASERQHWNELLAAVKRNDSSILFDPKYADIVKQWEAGFAGQAEIWQTLVPSTFLAAEGTQLQRREDDSLLATGIRPDRDTYTITALTNLTRLTALRLDVLADESLPMNGPGRQDNGNLHLSELEAFLFEPESTEASRLKIRRAVADWEQPDWTIAHAIDNDPATAWGVFPHVGESHYAVFELEQPRELKPSSQIVVVLKQVHGAGHLIGRLKLYATDADSVTTNVVPNSVTAALAVPMDQRSPEQRSLIAAQALQTHAVQRLDSLPPSSTVYAVSNRYSHTKKLDSPLAPKVVHVLRRGDIEHPGEVANPGALSAIIALPGRFDISDTSSEALRRAALADWLADDDNPLTWRSIVNRVWSYHFGRGLCDTPNDFGRMGGTPSHPELLDWLAVWFRDDAQGSLKKLHRLILLTDTYQRQSRSSATGPYIAAQSMDPQNRYLWRANPQLLDAESYRDAVLQVCGRIDLTMGGPGVEQFTQSKGVQNTPTLDYDAFDWNSPAAARRSIYRVVWRGIADPFMESLDFPDLGILAPNRGSSVSSLQALALFNNDFVLHHSHVLAEMLQAKYETIDEQVAGACRQVFLRESMDSERKLLVAYANKHSLAAMCRILLNSNEFVFVD